MAVIQVKLQEPDICRVLVGGQGFSIPAGEQALLATLKQEAKTHADAHIEGAPSVPYKCIAGAIVLAQKAGFQRVGFIAEPPPPSEQ